MRGQPFGNPCSPMFQVPRIALAILFFLGNAMAFGAARSFHHFTRNNLPTPNGADHKPDWIIHWDLRFASRRTRRKFRILFR